jgi:rhodanese-related sulfurtransferase
VLALCGWCNMQHFSIGFRRAARVALLAGCVLASSAVSASLCAEPGEVDEGSAGLTSNELASNELTSTELASADLSPARPSFAPASAPKAMPAPAVPALRSGEPLPTPPTAAPDVTALAANNTGSAEPGHSEMRPPVSSLDTGPAKAPEAVPETTAPPVGTPAPTQGHTGSTALANTGLAQTSRRPTARTNTRALALVENELNQVFPELSHLATERLVQLMSTMPDRLVLLDVRTAEEFGVSRMAGAVRIDPTTRSSSAVIAATGNLTGKIVVAYCAIGLRSSRLLVRIGQSLKELGAAEIHNLQGGAFRWRNEGFELVNGEGPTNKIHSYNILWRQLLRDDPDL